MSNASPEPEPDLPTNPPEADPAGEQPSRMNLRWWYRRGRGFGPPWRVILNALIIFLGAQFVAGVIIALFTVNNGQTTLDGLINGVSNVVVQFFYTGLAEGLAVVFVLWQLRRRFLTPKAIGLIKPRWRDLKKGLLGFAAFYGLLIVVTVIITTLLPIDTDQPQQLGFTSLSGGGDWLLAFAALVVFPPIAEEVVVRGYLFSGLRAHWSFVKAGLVTSLLFGFAHLQLGGGAPPLWAAAIDTFLLSMVLVYLREKTGALWAGVFVHVLNNFVAFMVHFHG